MSLYSKALRHINMSRVKELREENIKKQKLAEEKLQEEILRAHVEMIRAHYSKHYDWRRELEEGMTTAEMGMVNYAPTGDVDIVTTDQVFATSFNGNNESVSGGEVILSGTSNSIAGGTHTIYRRAMFRVDGSKSSTLKLTISKGGGTSSWTDKDPAESFNDDVKVNVYQASGLPDDPEYYNANLSSGTHLIPLPGQFEDLQIQIEQFAKVSETGSLRITGASLQRRTPVNVFVSLDDPEATAFIRDTLGNENLSPAQKKKKLEQMLGASAEYLTKMFGEGIFTGASEISDVQVQQSFTQIAQGLPYVDEDDAYDDDYYQGPVPDYMDDSDVDLPIELAKKTSDDPADWPSRHGPLQGPQGPSKDIPWVPEAPKANKKKSKQPQYAHYEPEGEVIVEKKKLKSPKSLLDKIPGYYDGKPAPLGFPIEEPPKMKNGMHPDLVDGKKVANRYNRLDPTSAKAMPKTGNPHIDRKVKAAAKNPK